MVTLHEFSTPRYTGAARRPSATDGLIAGMMAERFPVTDAATTIPHPAIAALPLAPCNTGPAPDWSVARLSEDRFRLTLAATGLSGDGISVRVQGGLLRIDGRRREEANGEDDAGAAMSCMFLLLEPLRLVDYGLLDGKLVIDLQRDHAAPCRADIPPRLRAAAALALAA